MIYTNATIDLDAQGRAIYAPLPFLAKKTMTLAGGTTNDPGDFDGTGNPANLFTITGDVEVIIFAVASVALVSAGGGTIEVGVASDTAGLIAQTTAANITIKKAWTDATPNLCAETQPSAHIVGRSQTIIQTVGTANITAGTLLYYCFWRPLSDTATLVAA